MRTPPLSVAAAPPDDGVHHFEIVEIDVDRRNFRIVATRSCDVHSTRRQVWREAAERDRRGRQHLPRHHWVGREAVGGVRNSREHFARRAR